MTQSVADRKIDTTTTIRNTMAVVVTVSLRDGHVTLAVSCRTSWMNFAGLTLAICLYYPNDGLILYVWFAWVLAGVEGLEPPAPGFGDRCSTN